MAIRETTSDFMLARLGQWGVTRLYGYPGDGINGLLGALGRAGDRMRFIQVRHEETAAFLACGSVSAGAQGYHLEFVLAQEAQATWLGCERW